MNNSLLRSYEIACPSLRLVAHKLLRSGMRAHYQTLSAAIYPPFRNVSTHITEFARPLRTA
jgi:hypothetical protein